MEATLTGIDSIVLFQNSQGSKGRGTLVHITRSLAIFEVYNPYSIVQMSEVLNGLKILRGERVIYNGKAVVSNIVNTGLMTIVSATLVDAWSDLSGLSPGKGLKEETARFVRDWEESHKIRPSYQLVVSSVSNFLNEVSRWLKEAEASLTATYSQDQEKINEELFEEIKDPIAPKLIELFARFEEEASQVSPEEETSHKAFARRQLHPLTMCSPFAHRSFVKPLGYAGDYEMVNMMLFQSEEKVSSVYAKVVDMYHLQSIAPEAHRNRIVMLEERLKEEALRVHGESRPFMVLNVGCGPALEIQHFIRREEIANYAVLHLMDFNAETIEYAQRKIEDAMDASGHQPVVKFIHKSIDVLLKEMNQRDGEKEEAKYDMVYCAGLFDYFAHSTCEQLTQLYYQWVRPGGLLTVTNVHVSNPNRYQMEHLLEWYLSYRDEKKMASFAPRDTHYEIVTDSTGGNVFLDVRKEE